MEPRESEQPGYASAPALRHSPRDHAAGSCVRKGNPPRPPLAKSVRGRVLRGPLTATAHQRDFEGLRVERLRAGAQSEASVRLRAPAAGPPPADGDERGAWNRGAFASISLRRALQRRPGWESLRPGRSVPTREAARRRGSFPANTVIVPEALRYRISRDSLGIRRAVLQRFLYAGAGRSAGG